MVLFDNYTRGLAAQSRWVPVQEIEMHPEYRNLVEFENEINHKEKKNAGMLILGLAGVLVTIYVGTTLFK